jgi:hypothetical protein
MVEDSGEMVLKIENFGSGRSSEKKLTGCGDYLKKVGLTPGAPRTYRACAYHRALRSLRKQVSSDRKGVTVQILDGVDDPDFFTVYLRIPSIRYERTVRFPLKLKEKVEEIIYANSQRNAEIEKKE